MAALLVFIGILVVCFLALRSLLTKVGLAPIVGYLLLGWIVSIITPHVAALSSAALLPLSVLSKIGLALLLFHIGLESHLTSLIRFLGKAGVIALCEIVVVGTTGWLVMEALGQSHVASLVVAIALTATSIGVATMSWRQRDLTKSQEGAILLDLATIDDIAGVLLMTLLFTLVPYLERAGEVSLYQIGLPLMGVAGLIIGCYLFSHFIEPRLMQGLIKYENRPDAMLTIVALGLIIASLAALIHTSFAIGAFFAGIAFSRDPNAVRLHVSMQSLLDLFVPFFFFWIGYQTVLSHLLNYWPLFLTLLAVTLVGKFGANWAVSRWVGLSLKGALLIGVSMIPRAEITMVIMEHSLILGLVSKELYSVVSLIVAISCLLTALAVREARRLTDRVSSTL